MKSQRPWREGESVFIESRPFSGEKSTFRDQPSEINGAEGSLEGVEPDFGESAGERGGEREPRRRRVSGGDDHDPDLAEWSETEVVSRKDYRL